MSTEIHNTDKLREFVTELKRLGIKVERPNVNKSFADFKAGNKKIFYGLNAIKNVGSEAISNIIRERLSKGEFKDINDFIERIDLKM